MSQPHHELIESYARGAEKLSLSIRGLTRDDLLAVPIPGKWSTQQVVIHLGDAEAAFADRIKRILATDEPVLLAWDETKFVEHLHYNQQSAADAVTIIDLTRRQVAAILRHVSPDAFVRAGQHNERGRQTIVEILNTAINHLEHHLKFIYEKREKMGKSMW